MAVQPKLIVPPYDSLPSSRQVLATTGFVFDGADGLNMAPTVQSIALGSAIKSATIFAPGFDHIELVVQVGDTAPYNGACGVAIVCCDESGTEIVEDEIGQFPAQSLGYTGIVRASYPGLYLFKLKLFSIGAACRVFAVRWLKLTKQ